MVMIQKIDMKIISGLIDIMELAQDEFRDPNRFDNFTLMTVAIESEISLFLNEFTSSMVGYNDTFAGRYAKFNQPIPFHIDGSMSMPFETEAAKLTNTSFLIPLKINPDGGDAHTIFFNQIDPYEPREQFHKHNEFRKHGMSGWRDSIDYSVLKNYTNEPFRDLDIYEKYLNHHPLRRLHGLSVHNVTKWKIGEVMVFESNRTHCGATFNGITSKDCFLVKAQTDWFEANNN